MLNRPVKQLVTLLLISLATGCSTPDLLKNADDSSKNHKIDEVLESTGITVTTVADAVARAQKAEQDGKTDLAQLYYVKAIDLEPNNTQILQKMADLYIRLNKFELAEVSLKLILKQQPDDTKTQEQYGLLLIKTRNYPEAAQVLNQVVAKQQSWPAYNGLGIIANLQGDPLKALSFFKKADAISPNSPELINNMGYAHYLAGELEEAASDYAKALAIDPDYSKALYNDALLQASTGNYDLAYTAFAKVATAAEANNNTGYIAMTNGDYEAAEHYLKEAIKSSPHFYKKAQDNLAKLSQLIKK